MWRTPPDFSGPPRPPDLSALTVALRAICETFDAAEAAATYVSPRAGRLVTLHVTAGGAVYLADEHDNAIEVPGSDG